MGGYWIKHINHLRRCIYKKYLYIDLTSYLDYMHTYVRLLSTHIDNSVTNFVDVIPFSTSFPFILLVYLML